MIKFKTYRVLSCDWCSTQNGESDLVSIEKIMESGREAGWKVVTVYEYTELTQHMHAKFIDLCPDCVVEYDKRKATESKVITSRD